MNEEIKSCRSKALSAAEVLALDNLAVHRFGIPPCVLMENAGRTVAQEILRQLRPIKKPFVVIVCGFGNNAGDGFVVARHLAEANVIARTFVTGKGHSLKPDAALNLKILKKLKLPVYAIKGIDTFAAPQHRSLGQSLKGPLSINPKHAPAFRSKLVEGVDKRFLRSIERSDLIVDAIFGVGLSRPVDEPFKSVIETINQSHQRVLAVDVPSGLDATTGRMHGVCIQAHTTVALTCPKKGFYKNDGPRHVGRIVVADIGIPKVLLRMKR